MKIALSYRRDFHKGELVQDYCEEIRKCLIEKGHDVMTIGEGHDYQFPNSPFPANVETLDPKYFDYLLEIDNGRNAQGEFNYGKVLNSKVKKAIWFIDSHGQPTLHHRLAPHYAHVFFAVFDKRDIFTGHRSAVWTPNATSARYFPKAVCTPNHLFGFFGSKGGLARANPLVEFCKESGWSYDVRQINGSHKPRFPYTAEAMANCAHLFNHGQKFDLNLRIFESMAVGRPLITDVNNRSGMDQLFVEGEHYIGYKSHSYEGLHEAMKWALHCPMLCDEIADRAHKLVMSKHLITHRVDQMLEVMNAS